MAENKFNTDVAKKLYEEATKVGKTRIAEDDFYNNLNDSQYAKTVYNRYKTKYGVDLLGAEDESSFLKALEYNSPFVDNNAKSNEPKLSLMRPKEDKKVSKIENPESLNTRVPNIKTVKDDKTGEDIFVDMDIPKTPDMSVNTKFDAPINKVDHLGEKNSIKSVFGVDSILDLETKQEKAWKEVYKTAPEAMANLGKDEVEEIYDKDGFIIGEKVIRTANEADLDRIQQIQQSIKEQYDAINKDNEEFIKQYDEYLNKSNANDVNLHHDEWRVVNPWERRKSENEMKFLKDNAEKYRKIMAAKEALNLQSKFARTYSDMVEYDMSLQKGEEMSAMVSSGEISEDAMKILRASNSLEASRQYIDRQVQNGTMSKATAEKLYKMGDLSEKNAFAYGFTHPGYAEDFLTFGMSEIKRNFDLKDINDRLKSGKEVGDDEKNALLMFSKMGEMLSEEKMDKRGWWFEAGQGLPKTLQFIAEIGLTGGTTAVGKGITRKVISESLKRYGLMKTGGMIAVNTAKRLVKNLGMQAIMSPVTPSSYVDYSNRILNLSLEQENISLEDRAKELYKSYAATTAGRFSETLDNVLFDMPVGSWLFGSKALRPVMVPAIRIAKKLDKLPWSKPTSDLLERFGIDGIHKEILTEMSDPVLQAAFTGDTEELENMWADKEDFTKTVALHSAILGGFHGAMGYGVGAAKAAIESHRVSKAYDDAMSRIKGMTFVDKQLNELKKELITAISTNNYVAQDGKNNGRTVGEILSDMDKRMQYYATTDKGTAAYEADKRVFDLADYTSRVGAYKFGEGQNIKDQVARRMGVAKTLTGGIIPMEFEHSDGNVYEFTDAHGKNYFILDGTDDTVVLMDRATGEKLVKNKSFTDIGTKTQTDANQWAMNEYLKNIDNWNAQDSQAQQTQNTVIDTPSHAMLRGVPVAITNFNSQTGEVTVTDRTGDELTMPVNSSDLELVYPNQQPQDDKGMQEQSEEVAGADNKPVEGVNSDMKGEVPTNMEYAPYEAPRGEDNDIVWNEVPADKFKQVIDEEVGAEYADGYIDMRIEDAQKKLNEHNEKTKPIASGEYKAFMEESKKLESDLAYWTNAKQEYANAVAQEVAAQSEVATPAQEEANEVAPESTVMYDAKQPEQVEIESPVQVSKEEMDKKVSEWGAYGVKVNVVNSIDEIADETIKDDIKKGIAVTGWYEPKTGEVYAYAPNLSSLDDVDKTIIHEVVAHKGLRGLIGEKYYRQFCEKVFDSMPKKLQDEYLAYPRVNGDKAAAADEYIAYLSEKEDLTAAEQKFWDRIIQFFREWFDARLVGILKKDTITDADIAKLIRMSYANIKNNAQNGISSDNTETDTTEGDVRYSIDTMYEAVGLRYEKGNDGETIIKNAKGDIVGDITEEMINKSPLGISLVDAVKNGMITEKERKQQLSFYKDLYNMHLRVNDLDLIYAVSGALGFQPVEPGPRDMSKSDINGKKQPFAAITSNADKQYSTTIDFTTICKKTQAVINNMSTIMIKLGRGLTKEEIVDIVFKNTHKAGEPVPCPVCYVFSRWVGLGGLFDNIKRLQNKYADADVETLRRDIAILNEKVDAIAEENNLDRTDSKKKLRKGLQEELDKLSRKEEFGKKLTDKEKALADKLTEQIFQIDNLTWLTDVRTAEGYKPVPDHILFDINAGVEFASEYPLTWKFRTTRGPSMGKAASPYSPLHFGQVMLGIGKSDLKDIKDPSKNMVLNLTKKGVWNKNIDKSLRASRVKAKVQNLLNGQRLQSTSDWRFEYALDQLLAMIELQNIGAKAQLYTKVAEAIPFFATCNAEVNCSLMPKGDGYKMNEDGSMELVFSRVTGMDERDAFMYSNKYDNVQPILVGINDTHMRLAMRDGRITFIIPFHASGGAEAQYKSMMEALGERYDDKREDYSPYQSDRRLPEEKRTKAQNDAYDLRIRILHSAKTGKDADTGILNDAERAVLENNAILRNLYERFYGKTIDGKEIKVKDPECYQVSVGTDQSKLIFPYEYWDKTSTIETADVNGARFIEYCNALGIVPRFSGYNGQFKYNAEKDFTKDENGNPMPGYWKLLIDRKMYNNDGTYHIQKPVNVTNMDASYIDPKTPRPEISTPSRNNNPAKEAEVVKKSIQEIRDNEQKTNDGPRYRTSAEIVDAENAVQYRIVTDEKVIAELEASPKKIGYRNVVLNEDGTFSSPMAYWLQSIVGKAKTRIETAKFEMNKWEEAEEHPELVDENGKITLVKPNKKTVDVAYDPYIHNRLDPVNLQFKEAWNRPNLVYIRTEVAEIDLNSGYHAEHALLPVGTHSWSNGDLMLSKYDKPIGIVPWDEVADAWVNRLNGKGVEFDVVPPQLRQLLVDRGVEILPPHKGSGKECNDAYNQWKENNPTDPNGGPRYRVPNGEDNQGNPIDGEGHYILTEIDDISEITDDDFINPTRNIKLPALPKNVNDAIGGNNKPVIIKRNIFIKNRDTHKELLPQDGRDILSNALYNTSLVGQTQPIRKPNYKVAVHTADKNSVVILDVYENNDNIEIVGWRKISNEGLERMKKQAKREGGQFLILSPENRLAAALSTLPSDLLSNDKDNQKTNTNKSSDEKVQSEDDIRFRTSQPFYSNAEMAVQGVKQEKATPEQWIAMLTKNGGLKAGEDRWLGLSDWLKAQKGSVTKQDILDYINANKIEIEEVNYSENPTGDERKIASIRLDYTTEGLENKKEIALVVPNIKSYEDWDAVHFGDAGDGRAIAWVRFGDLTEYNELSVEIFDALGKVGELNEKDYVVGLSDTEIQERDELIDKIDHFNRLYNGKVLVIDEIQSKRHQDARDTGYAPTIDEFKSSLDDFKSFNKEMKAKYGEGTYPADWSEEDREEFNRLRDKHSMTSKAYQKGVPAAPFEKNWHELAMKRMLRYAAENGYARVAWTTGATQAERYSIGEVIDNITLLGSWSNNPLEEFNGRKIRQIYVNTKDGNDFPLTVNDNGIVVYGPYKDQKLSDIVGKELAKKLMDAEPNIKIEGDGLRVGGEGMKGFYDKMLVDFMNKYGKKWGVKVSTEMSILGEEMHFVEVTDAMVRSVMEGQPMFRVKSDRQESIKTRQRAENIMKDAIAPIAQELGVEVNYVTNETISDVEPGARKKRQSKGWYQDGKVYINLSTHETIDDAKETYLHEVVAHYGLRGLLKDQFEPVMKKVFASLTPTQQQSLLEIFADEVEAAEEFLASMAENDIDPSLVEKILGFIRDALRSMGINLDNYTNGDLEYLLWRSKNNLRENAGKIETAQWEAEDKEIRYRTFKNGRLSSDTKYGVIDKKIEQFKDSMWSVKLLQDEIVARGGIVDDISDPYGQSTLMSQKSSYEIGLFNSTIYKPMLKAFSKAAKAIRKAQNISIFEANEKLENYLYAKHAIERNKKLAIDKMIRKASENFAALTKDQRVQLETIVTALYEDAYTGGTNNVTVTLNGTDFELSINGVPTKSEFTDIEFDAIKTAIDDWVAANKEVNESGLTDKDAQTIIDEVYTNQNAETQDLIDQLSDNVKNCTTFILDTWLKYGIISNSDYNKYKSQYEHYVPLRGWDETSDVDYEDVAGNAYNKAEKIVSLNNRAKGRKSKADSPLAFISQMATSAIIYGNKNLMKTMAFNMIKNNYDLIQDLVFIEDNDVLTHKTKSEIKAHEVQLKFNGRTTRFSFKDDFEVGVAAASAIKGDNIQNFSKNNLFDQLLLNVGKVTRFQSRARTSWNPVFMIVNGVRDYFFGNLSFFVKYGLKDTVALNKNYAIGFAAAFMDAAGIPIGNSQWRQDCEAYKREGGQTGYVHMDDIARLKRETSKILRRYQNGMGFIPQDTMKLISYTLRVMGEPAENAMRFATFKTLRDSGMSDRIAAKAAKEITVNFNRTGTQKWPGMLYGFFNATLEGTANYFKMGFDKKTAARFWMANAALAALSYTTAWWAKGFGDDDDDELIAGMTPEELAEYKQMKEFTNEYNRISDYVKHTNILIPVTGDNSEEKKFIAIPLPQSYRMSAALGTTLFNIINGGNNLEDELREFAWFTIGEIQPFDIENISFEEGDGLLANAERAFSPTAILPFVEVKQNRNFMGNPIFKESFINENYQSRIEPSFTKAGSQTPEFLIATAKEINEKLGGTEYMAAKENEKFAQNRLDAHGVDYTLAKVADALDPASVDHILKGYFGGFYELGAGAVDRYMKDQTSAEDWVLAKRFLKEATQKPGMEKYFERKEFADEVDRVLKNEKKNARRGESRQYFNSDPYNRELVKINEYWKKKIKKETDSIAKLKKKGIVDEEKMSKLEARRDDKILQAALAFERLERKYNK